MSADQIPEYVYGLIISGLFALLRYWIMKSDKKREELKKKIDSMVTKEEVKEIVESAINQHIVDGDI